MNRLFSEWKDLFQRFGLNDDLINMYLVFMGVRTSCLIGNVNMFNVIPNKSNLEIYYGRYPGYMKNKRDYPLVCLKNSIVSKSIQSHNLEFTEHELGLYLGFSCYDQDWSNLRINRYAINYSVNKVPFYDEVCTKPPDIGTLSRIKFRAKQMTLALRLINPNYTVKHRIDFLPKLILRKRNK